jgi:hypothetical protein
MLPITPIPQKIQDDTGRRYSLGVTELKISENSAFKKY